MLLKRRRNSLLRSSKMNFDRFLHIISKWPLKNSKKALDYGCHLRELVKMKDISGNVFPGTSEENSKKLDALLRLLNDTYNNKYPCRKEKGGSGLDIKNVDMLLANEKFIKVHKEKIFKSEVKDKEGKEPKSDKT